MSATQPTDPYEELLRELRLEWVEVEVPLKDIDIKASVAFMQVRDEQVDPTLVDRYAEALKSGAVFKPVILHLQGEKYLIDDGHHRIRAHAVARRSTITAWVLTDPAPATIRAFRRRVNLLNGLPLSAEEAIRLAVDMVSEDQVPIRVAARVMRLNEHALKNRLATIAAEKRVGSLVPGLLYRGSGVLNRIDDIRDDAMLIEVGEMLQTPPYDKASERDISTLVTSLNAVTSATAKQQVLEDWRAEMALKPVTLTTKGTTEIRTFRRALSLLDRNLDVSDRILDYVFDKLGETQRRGLAEDAERIAKRLDAISQQMRES